MHELGRLSKAVRETVRAIWDVDFYHIQTKFLPGPQAYGAKIVVPYALEHKAVWVEEDEPMEMVQVGPYLRRPLPAFGLINLVFDHWLVPWKYLGAYDETHRILFVAKGETLDDRT